jgi:hypothetical protein
MLGRQANLPPAVTESKPSFAAAQFLSCRCERLKGNQRKGWIFLLRKSWQSMREQDRVSYASGFQGRFYVVSAQDVSSVENEGGL